MKRLNVALLAGAVTGALTLAPLMPAAASSGSGLGSATATLGAPLNVTAAHCSFPAAYSWSGFAGSSDTAAIWLTDSLYGTVTGVVEQAKMRGASGSLSHTFDGLIPGVRYAAWGKLMDSHGNVLLGSLVFSSFASC